MGKTYSFVDTTALGARVIALLKACLFTKFGMVFMNIDRIVAVRRAGEDVVIMRGDGVEIGTELLGDGG